jgi:hypothetical protein
MGYIISEIGHTLTVMRLAQDDFEQDIQNADTICNNYQLSLDLRHKVRKLYREQPLGQRGAQPKGGTQLPNEA